MNPDNQQSIASQNIPQQNILQTEDNTNLSPQDNSKKSSKKKVLIIIILLIILLPILYFFVKLTLTGLVIYSNLTKLPKSTPQATLQPQTNYVATPLPTSSSNPLERVQTQARNEKRKLDIDTLAKALEQKYGLEIQNQYPAIQDSWFAAGKVPKDPSGTNYLGIPTTPVSSFNICANLEDVTSNQYCIKSQH